MCFTVIITLSMSAVLLSNVLRKDIAIKEISVGNAISMINTVQLNDDYIWPVKPEDADLFIDSEYVNRYNKVFSFNNIAFHPVDFNAVIKNPDLFYSDDYVIPHTAGEGLDLIPYGQIAGITDSEYFDYFSSGGYSLVLGEHFHKDNSGEKIVLISENLADINNLSVGDSITIELCSYEAKSFSKHSTLEEIEPKLSLTITGIFSHNTRELDTEVPAMDPDDLLFIPYDTIENWIGMENAMGLNSALVYLNNKNETNKFIEECKTKLPIDYVVDSVTNKPLWSAEEINDFGYTLQVDAGRYEMVNAPIESSSKMIIWFSLLIGVSGLVILILLTVININKRIYELGLRLALGQKKAKVIALLITENIIPVVIASLIALFLSVGIGTEFAQITTKPTTALTEAKNENFNNDFLDYLDSVGTQKENAKSYSMDFTRRGVNAVMINNTVNVEPDIIIQASIVTIFIILTLAVSFALCIKLAACTPAELLRRRK